MKTREQIDAEYNASLNKFREASRFYRELAQKYRDKKIGDAAFSVALHAFKVAQEDADKAEREYIEAVNALDAAPAECPHDWELSWPNDPCEYTCKRCGSKIQH